MPKHAMRGTDRGRSSKNRFGPAARFGCSQALVSKLKRHIAAPLAAAGGYTIGLNPLNGAVGRYTFTLSSTISQTLSLNSSDLGFVVARPGQDGRGSWQGLAGHAITVTAKTPAGKPAQVEVLRYLFTG